MERFKHRPFIKRTSPQMRVFTAGGVQIFSAAIRQSLLLFSRKADNYLQCSKSLFLSFFTCITVLFFQNTGYAALNLELTKGIASALPIAVIPFAGENDTPVKLSAIINNDLSHSGEFAVLPEKSLPALPQNLDDIDTSIWQEKHINDLIIGRVTELGNHKYQVTYALVDTFSPKETATLLDGKFIVPENALSRLAHHISDLVYQRLTGTPGIFSTKIAYVLVSPASATQPRTYRLEIADIDGENPLPILTSGQPIMSPAWSPDGRRLAYVSFESYLPQIYISDISSGKRQLVTHFEGINGAPAWSPDGRYMAVALSKHAPNPNIYLLNLASQQLTQITNDWSINTEPSFAPDGKSLLFTSDRGGSPQLYQINLETKMTQRLTFDGNYNATGRYTPDGKSIVFLHRGAAYGSYNVAIMDLATGNIKELTDYGKNQSPSIAPNGKMVVFAAEYQQRGVLGIVSTNGKVSLRIPDPQGSVEQPAWSPFLDRINNT